MKLRSAGLNALAGTASSVLAFDCEFWHVGEQFLPREIGGFHAVKKGDSWTVASFMAILPAPPNQLNRVSSKFSTVTEETSEALDILEETERTARELLSDNDITDVYFADKLVKPYVESVSWLKTFVAKFPKSVVVLKGDTDLNAIEAACKRAKFAYHKPLRVVDIATHNPEFTKKCKTAKLEGAYECIAKELDADLKRAFPIGRAHNPVSDAAMALQIAVWLIKKDIR